MFDAISAAIVPPSFLIADVLLTVGKDASRPLEVVSAADARFSSRVELSVRFGKTLLVLECDGVEPMLYPLARQDLVHQGPRFVVQVGDKVRRPERASVKAEKGERCCCLNDEFLMQEYVLMNSHVRRGDSRWPNAPQETRNTSSMRLCGV